MSKIKVGDRAKIKDRPDWPTPPGYKLADSEGDVTAEKEEAGFVTIRLTKTSTNIPIGTVLDIRLENVEKVIL